ncbi:PhnD/SsuA/transferrin family substrate-binding protein [Sporosarcina sp. G11-34]|uniref:PhnD/SsuA/transferrin family substrate-binding protein n=1 Tax=Sporosarcina sp. G11-34 TaxID=2849605 RepID=UPI0022A90BE9|nr:PhnD/SsuA/transferrin family substrate-binding protein [Sporosarcina sp. G11-34]MCZ2259173.1 PhnD/SsuA/transferrin family substrate-binding protein [Sporosarcina sp. G11-34]
MKKNLLSFLTMFFLVLILTACSTGSAADSDKLTMVWYPNESGNDLKAARDEIGKAIEDVTGKKIDHKLTTDYAIAIETIANGNAELAFMGAQGYIEAKNKNDKIQPIVVPSGESGTIDDAVYYSWLAVRKADTENYKTDGELTIDNIVDAKFSFVSSSSTSGFKVPSSDIVSYFSKEEKWKVLTQEDLMDGGPFFKDVLYGDSHQGSAVNLLNGRADVAAFCDTCVANYVELAEGEENTKGAIYKIQADAAEPFNTQQGEEFTLINVTPVLNAPFAANMETLSKEDFKKIQELLISDEISNNESIFVPADSEAFGLFTKKANERFVSVNDDWFNPIRELSK